MARDLAFLDHDRPAPRLLAEAGRGIVAASIAIRLTSFDRLAQRLERTPVSPHGESSEQVYWIRRAPMPEEEDFRGERDVLNRG